MSNLTTPTRHGRGLLVPGIDTKLSLDDPTSVLSYGGLHTPPQSAHESRRPSLQYSAAMEASFSAASTFSYHPPTTPVHGLPDAGHAVQRWPETVNHGLVMANANVYNTGHLAGSPLGAPFEPSTAASELPPTMHSSDHSSFQFGTDAHLQDMEIWHSPQHALNDYGSSPAYLGSALPIFPPAQTLPSPHTSVGATYGGSFASSFDNTSTQYGANFPDEPDYSPHSFQVSPQVVVPSQLSPLDDCSAQNLENCQQTFHQSGPMPSSFSSSTSGYMGYDVVDPPSPTDAYFAQSEDGDYAAVKCERLDTPASPNDMAESKAGYHIPLRQKRRAVRRQRNAARGNNMLHSHISQEYNCMVQVAGKGISVSRDGQIKVEVASSKKPHVCTFVEKDGKQCGQRFDRSEHLKRHDGKHREERNYPCPMPGCGKAIQRPDNAGDHFKTHLRPKKKGKRNQHFSYPEIETAILSHYEDQKKARKLIDGLRRWIAAGMPEAGSNRRGSAS